MQKIYAKDKNITQKNEVATVCIGGIYVELPIVPLKGLPISIILFDSFGKMRLIQDIAQEAVKCFIKPDCIVCPEAKSIPVAQEMARLWNIEYFVLRKAKKLYMKEPKSIDTQSITTANPQQLWYDEMEVQALKGKKIMLFDDVISTGGTIASVVAFQKACELEVSSIASIFLEGESAYVKSLCDDYTLEHLGFLPILE